MKVIEGEFRFVGEDEIRERETERRRRRRRLPGWVRWTLRQPLFWIWTVMLTVVGLTEGLW